MSAKEHLDFHNLMILYRDKKCYYVFESYVPKHATNRFSLIFVTERECESTTKVLSFVLRKCVKNKSVPVKSQYSVYSFALPSSLHSLSSCDDKSENSDEEVINDVESSGDEEGLYYCKLKKKNTPFIFTFYSKNSKTITTTPSQLERNAK